MVIEPSLIRSFLTRSILNLYIKKMPWVRMAEVLREKLLVLPVTGNILESSTHSFLMLALVNWARHFLNNNVNLIANEQLNSLHFT